MRYISQCLKMFKRYFRENTIVQADGDSGDSAQRVFTFTALLGIIKYESPLNWEDVKKAHTASPSVYRRSPLPEHWGFRANNFSRDQWQSMQLAAAVVGDKVLLRESMAALLARFGFHQNVREGADGDNAKIPDIAHPGHFSVYIRGMGLWWLYPVLYIIDICFLLDLIFRKNSTDYDNMLAPQLLYANVKYSTLISRIAMHYYCKTNFMKCLENYHSTRRNGILPFPALFWAAYQKKGYVK